MAYDIPSISDLEAVQLLNKHYAEVITSKKDGIASGQDITQTTNPITGVTRRTLYKILDDMDVTFLERLLKMAFTPVGTFTAGATLTDARQTLLWEVSEGGDGHYYSWSGSFPKAVAAGSSPSPIAAGSWVDRTDDSLRDEIRETVFQNTKRLAAEAGYNLVDGSFEEGANISGWPDVVWSQTDGKYYQWHLNEAKTVPAGSTPTTTGGIGALLWVDRTDLMLRNEPEINQLFITTVIGDGVTDNSTAISAANAAGYPIQFIGVSVVSSATTITVPIVDTLNRIFTDTSVITIANGLPVRPEWFGDTAENIKRAVDSLPATGGVVQLENRRYPRSYSMDRANQGAGIAYLSKPNVAIIGAKTPHNNTGYTALEGGTIIDGPFSVFADGFYGDKFGVDAGYDTCHRLWADVHPDAFNMATSSESGGVVLSASLGIISTMGGGVDAQSHGLLVQGHKKFTFDTIYAYTQAHGVAIKAEFVAGREVRGVGNTYEACILKSNVSTPMRYADIGVVVGTGLSSYEAGSALILHAADANLQEIHVGTVLANNKTNAVQLVGEAADLYSVVIDNIIPAFCRRAVDYADTAGHIKSSHIGHIESNNTDDLTSIPASMTSRLNTIGSATMNGYYNGLIAAGTIVLDSFSVSDIGNAILVNGGGKTLLGKLHTTGTVTNKNNIPLTLNANWSLGAALEIKDYGCALAGFVYAGTGAGSTIIAAGVIPSGMRSPAEKRFVVPTSAGTATVIVRTDGSISLSSAPVAGTTVYLDSVNWSV